MSKGSKGSATNAVAFGGLLFLILRLLAISHYDWDVAFALADSVNFDDVIGVLVGTFLGAATLTGVLLALVLPLVVARHFEHLKNRELKPHQTVLVVVLVAIFVAAMVTMQDWVTLLVVLVASTLVFVVMRRSGPLKPYLDKAVSHMGVVAWLAFLALGGLTDTVWVPKEDLGLRGGGTVTGYVMDVHSPYTEVLTADGRQVRFLLTNNVVSRADAD